MEITEHERVLLVNSLIQTISELYEHDGDNDRPALGALLTRMTAADRGPVRRVRGRIGHGPGGLEAVPDEERVRWREVLTRPPAVIWLQGREVGAEQR